MILFSSEAEPASSTTSCRIYYNRFALLEACYALSDLVHIPCGFVAEGYWIPHRFKLASRNVKIAVTDPRGDDLNDNLAGAWFRPVTINYGKQLPWTC